jgi:uncharacterized RDD family membrane protein YckC
MANVNIETSQNVSLDYQAASVGDRILGGIIDFAIIFAYVIGLSLVAGPMIHGEISEVIFFFIFTLPAVFYSLLCETFLGGQSFGKKATHTKVIMLDGSQPGFGNYIIRWIFRIIDVWLSIGVPGIVAIIVIAANNRGQRLGDILANTSVVKIRRKVFLEDTLLGMEDKDYNPVFAQAYQLNDQQYGLIKDVMNAYQKEHNYLVVKAMSEKLRDLLHIESNLGHVEFLETLLKDYAHITDKVNFTQYKF